MESKQIGTITWNVTEGLGYGKHPEMITAQFSVEFLGKTWNVEDSFVPVHWKSTHAMKEFTRKHLTNLISKAFKLDETTTTTP